MLFQLGVAVANHQLFSQDYHSGFKKLSGRQKLPGPSNTTVTNAIPSNVFPSNTFHTKAIPADIVNTSTIPTNSVNSNVGCTDPLHSH